MAVDTVVMLELLEEAGEEAVTLDELGVAGVRDPARALLELELAGLGIQRVLVGDDLGRGAVECVRLAAAPDEQPTVELAAVAPRAAAPSVPPMPQPAPAPEERAVRAWVLAGLLLAVLALLLRRS
jgi:hypothetical protein